MPEKKKIARMYKMSEVSNVLALTNCPMNILNALIITDELTYLTLV